MNKPEFISRVYDDVHDRRLGKLIVLPSHSITITDEEGNTTKYKYKSGTKLSLYNKADVQEIFESCIRVAIDALKHGESINISGFGKLSLKKHKGGVRKDLATGEWHDVPDYYVAKFECGKTLKFAVKTKELIEQDAQRIADITYCSED